MVCTVTSINWMNIVDIVNKKKKIDISAEFDIKAEFVSFQFVCRLSEILKDYKEIMAKSPSIMQPLMVPFSEQVEESLKPGLTSLNWTSLSLNGCKLKSKLSFFHISVRNGYYRHTCIYHWTTGVGLEMCNGEIIVFDTWGSPCVKHSVLIILV